MKETSCCFTGHRKIPVRETETVRRRIREKVTELYRLGFDTFLVGGAIGFDMLAAETLLDMRDAESLKLRMHSMLPFPAWREKWEEDEIRRQDRIMARSDLVTFCMDHYFKQVYYLRDVMLVDNAAYCIAWCKRTKGGTAFTVRHALRKGVPVCNTADWDIRRLQETE